jgi:hypothetical protein
MAFIWVSAPFGSSKLFFRPYDCSIHPNQFDYRHIRGGTFLRNVETIATRCRNQEDDQQRRVWPVPVLMALCCAGVDICIKWLLEIRRCVVQAGTKHFFMSVLYADVGDVPEQVPIRQRDVAHRII